MPSVGVELLAALEGDGVELALGVAELNTVTDLQQVQRLTVGLRGCRYDFMRHVQRSPCATGGSTALQLYSSTTQRLNDAWTSAVTSTP